MERQIKEVPVNMIVTIKYKQILRVGKGTIFGKANYASTSKYDCHNKIQTNSQGRKRNNFWKGKLCKY